MEDLSFRAACDHLGRTMTPGTRTANAIGRVTAEVALCREAQANLADRAHDLLVLLDDTDPPVTRDEAIGHAVDRLDQLVHRARATPGGAGAAPAEKTITQDRVR